MDIPLISAMRRFFDPNIKAARQRAMKYVRECNPAISVSNALLRAEEPSRYVFAVFYQNPTKRVIPGLYKIVAVSRDSDAVEELETSPESRYWIRDRK